MWARVLVLFVCVAAVNAAPAVTSKKAFLRPTANDALVSLMTDVAGVLHGSVVAEWKAPSIRLLDPMIQHRLKAVLDHVVKAKLSLLDFSKQCALHTRTLVDNIDVAYTDAQLRGVLEQHCKMPTLFPASLKYSVISEDVCMQAASDLTKLRSDLLQTVSLSKYASFCERLYADSKADAYDATVFAHEAAEADKENAREAKKELEKVQTVVAKENAKAAAKKAKKDGKNVFKEAKDLEEAATEYTTEYIFKDVKEAKNPEDDAKEDKGLEEAAAEIGPDNAKYLADDSVA